MDHQSTSTAVATTTEQTQILSTILVIPSYQSAAYHFFYDGSSRSPASINAPVDGYTRWSKHALVQNKLHIFGGETDWRKIARLEGCDLVQLQWRLNIPARSYAAALSISSGFEALICFGECDAINCDVFTGSSVYLTYNTTYTHYWGGLGFYNGRATTVGSEKDHATKVETLTETGWMKLTDHPTGIDGHMLVGLENRDFLAISGWDRQVRGYSSKIWRLSNNAWSHDGDLQQPIYNASPLKIDNYIYIFPGYSQEERYNAIQKISLSDNSDIKETEIIGFQSTFSEWPVLYQSNTYFCSSKSRQQKIIDNSDRRQRGNLEDCQV